MDNSTELKVCCSAWVETDKGVEVPPRGAEEKEAVNETTGEVIELVVGNCHMENTPGLKNRMTEYAKRIREEKDAKKNPGMEK